MERASVGGVALCVIPYKIRSDNLEDQRIKQALAFDLSMIQSQISFNSKQHTELQQCYIILQLSSVQLVLINFNHSQQLKKVENTAR